MRGEEKSGEARRGEERRDETRRDETRKETEEEEGGGGGGKEEDREIEGEDLRKSVLLRSVALVYGLSRAGQRAGELETEDGGDREIDGWQRCGAGHQRNKGMKHVRTTMRIHSATAGTGSPPNDGPLKEKGGRDLWESLESANAFTFVRARRRIRLPAKDLRRRTR